MAPMEEEATRSASEGEAGAGAGDVGGEPEAPPAPAAAAAEAAPAEDSGPSSSADEPSGAVTDDGFDWIKTMNEAKTKPCTVNKLDIVGNEKTKRKVILRELEAVKRAQNLEEMWVKVNSALAELEDLGIFKSVDAVVSPKPLAPTPAALIGQGGQDPILATHALSTIIGSPLPSPAMLSVAGGARVRKSPLVKLMKLNPPLLFFSTRHTDAPPFLPTRAHHRLLLDLDSIGSASSTPARKTCRTPPT